MGLLDAGVEATEWLEDALQAIQNNDLTAADSRLQALKELERESTDARRQLALRRLLLTFLFFATSPSQPNRQCRWALHFLEELRDFSSRHSDFENDLVDDLLHQAVMRVSCLEVNDEIRRQLRVSSSAIAQYPVPPMTEEDLLRNWVWLHEYPDFVWLKARLFKTLKPSIDEIARQKAAQCSLNARASIESLSMIGINAALASEPDCYDGSTKAIDYLAQVAATAITDHLHRQDASS